MYKQGTGVLRNDIEAVHWFRRSAAEQYARAQTNLANMLAAGRGVERDVDEAMGLFRLAAEQGEAQAQRNLQLLLEQGLVAPNSAGIAGSGSNWSSFEDMKQAEAKADHEEKEGQVWGAKEEERTNAGSYNPYMRVE